jgi:hypothetical protein
MRKKIYMCVYTRMSKRVSNKHPLARVSIRHPFLN